MNEKLFAVVLSLSLLLVLPLLASSATGVPDLLFEEEFKPVVLPENPPEVPVRTPDVLVVEPPSVIYEGFDPLKIPGSRPDSSTKAGHSMNIPMNIPMNIQIDPSPVKGTHSIRGVASWYCKAGVSVCHYQYPPGSMVAAACGKMRAALKNWRGKTVHVVRGGRSVDVKLVDYCAHPSRVLDLYYEPMRQLGGTGLLNVTVSW